jgi:hypothetical protein
MSRTHKNAIAFVCSDGRLHHGGVNINEKIRQLLDVDYVYVIAIPGPDGILAKRDSPWCVTACEQFDLLLKVKSPVIVGVVGHTDCAGNPVSDNQHKHDIQDACSTVSQWGYGGDIRGLLVQRVSDSEWQLLRTN